MYLFVFLSVYWSVYVNMQRDILLLHTILYLYLYLSVMTYLPKNQLAFSAVLPLWLSTPLQIHRYIFEIHISLKTRIQVIDEKCCAVCMACKMFMSSELCLVVFLERWKYAKYVCPPAKTAPKHKFSFSGLWQSTEPVLNGRVSKHLCGCTFILLRKTTIFQKFD